MKVVPFISLICFSLISFSQDTSNRNKLNVKIGVSYQSTLHYYGRVDSLKSSGFFPQLELWSGEIFYLSATPVLLNNAVASMQYAGTVATAGMIHSSERSFLHVYMMKPFYKDQSLVQSALKAQAGISHSFLSKFLNLTLGVDGKLSDKFDVGASAGIDHVWRHQFRDNSILVIDPTLMINAGTQHFTSSYYKQSQFNLFPGVTETKNVTQFAVLSYEASMPLIYRKGCIMLTTTPAYVIPKNLITSESASQQSESGKEMFYMTVSIKMTL